MKILIEDEKNELSATVEGSADFCHVMVTKICQFVDNNANEDKINKKMALEQADNEFLNRSIDLDKKKIYDKQQTMERQLWTKEEDEILRNAYKKFTAVDIVESHLLPGRSYQAVTNRIGRLGLKKHKSQKGNIKRHYLVKWIQEFSKTVFTLEEFYQVYPNFRNGSQNENLMKLISKLISEKKIMQMDKEKFHVNLEIINE